MSDLDTRNFLSKLVTVEIGALGHWLPTVSKELRRVLPSLSKSEISILLDLAGKSIVSFPKIIFMARNNPLWNLGLLNHSEVFIKKNCGVCMY